MGTIGQQLNHNITHLNGTSYAMYYLQAEQWVSEGKLYFKRDGHILKVIPDGNTYCCVGEGFVNLQESDNYAFGDTS